MLQVREFLEAAMGSRIQDHIAVMMAIEGIGACLSALDNMIATSDASAACSSPDDAPPLVPTPSRVAPRPAGSTHMPVPLTWGHDFHPSAPAPAPAPPPRGLRVDMAPADVPGGRIKTPRSTDVARRARNMKTNRFDLAGLADTGYHIGDFGVDTLTEMIISNCGYQSFHVDHPEDVLLCFQEIINIHRVVIQTWTNTRTHFSGPVVEYILEKALPVFPCLQDLDVAGMVKFYDGLQKISMRYLLPIMPFDSIRLAFGYEGLCPPGLGTACYSAIASAWMDVLPCLLPLKEPLVELAIFSVSVESNNCFDLLWRTLELVVLGFKSMNPVQVPSWTPHSGVLSFCREHLLYFRLQSKHNMFFSARTQTNIFLHNIQLSEYADVVTTLQSQVNVYLADDDEGYLPANLCINGIATAIHMNALARVRDVGFAPPRVRRVAGDWDSPHFLLFLMPSSRCVRSKVTLHGHFVWNRDRTTSVAPMFRMVLLAAVAMALTVTRWDTVDVILNVMDGVPLRGIGPSARISAVVLLFQVCNAMHVSGLGTRPPAVICWPSLCSWINTSNNLFLMMSTAILSQHGSPSGRRSWVSPNVLPLKLLRLIVMIWTFLLATLTLQWTGTVGL
jgi:hypothetical protein